MKREFLKDLGLEADVIGKIMDEAGRDAEAAKTAMAELKQSLSAKDTELEGLKGQIAQRDADIKALKDSALDAEGLKKTADEWQAKYKTDTEALNKKLIDQQTAFARQTASEKFFGDVKFSSGLAYDDQRSRVFALYEIQVSPCSNLDGNRNFSGVCQ